MSLLKKVKDILFEEEEYTEPIQIKDDVKEESKIVKIESPKEEVKEMTRYTPTIEEPVKVEKTFQFPDFDEEEFQTISRVKEQHEEEYERPKTYERRVERVTNDHVEKSRSEVAREREREVRETREREIDKKKFKPSPIISPVYGILNQDYRAEDIIDRTETTSNIDIDVVRKKAFEPKSKPKEEIIDDISEPVVTFFEEKDEEPEKLEVSKEEKRDYKTIDDLLEEASTEVDYEDEVKIPSSNNLEEIEEELEKIDVDDKNDEKKVDDTADNDLFELIDSMYDDREEE